LALKPIERVYTDEYHEDDAGVVDEILALWMVICSVIKSKQLPYLFGLAVTYCLFVLLI